MVSLQHMIIIKKKFPPFSPCLPKPRHHSRGDLVLLQVDLPLLLDVGHLEPGPRGRHHRRVEGYQETRELREPEVVVEVEVEVEREK